MGVHAPAIHLGPYLAARACASAGAYNRARPSHQATSRPTVRDCAAIGCPRTDLL